MFHLLHFNNGHCIDLSTFFCAWEKAESWKMISIKWKCTSKSSFLTDSILYAEWIQNIKYSINKNQKGSSSLHKMSIQNVLNILFIKRYLIYLQNDTKLIPLYMLYEVAWKIQFQCQCDLHINTFVSKCDISQFLNNEKNYLFVN